jgi:hypothetical protein
MRWSPVWPVVCFFFRGTAQQRETDSEVSIQHQSQMARCEQVATFAPPNIYTVTMIKHFIVKLVA